MTRETSIWRRLLERVEKFGTALISRTGGTGSDSVTFSISFIALAAKLAKADGVVTKDEVMMFRKIFHIPANEEANAARVYNLCRQDSTGYEAYARRMHRSLGLGEEADQLRLNVLDGLFHIAMADGEFHENEKAFLREVAGIFCIPEAEFMRLMSTHVPDHEDPFDALGVAHDCDVDDLRRAWKVMARENHPDILLSKGLPQEMMALATSRMSAINNAYAQAREIIEHRTAGLQMQMD